MKITNQLLFEWKEWMLNKEFSINTISNYETDVKLFLNYLRLKTQGSIVNENEITLMEIEKRKTYLRWLPTPKNSIYYTIKPTISQSTIQSKLTAVKSLLKYINLFYNCWLDYTKIETKRIKSDYIDYITQTEFELLENFISQYEKYKINALRMKLLCNIGYTSWLRLSEMLGLTVKDIEKKNTRIIWKGNKARRVFFTNSTEKLLKEYLQEREKPIPRTWIKEKKSDYVFISHNSGYDYGNPIKKETVCGIMKKYSDWLDIWKRITVHSLRHSYATRLLESWLNIREIQELLWHKDLKTTQNYCHVLESELKDKVNQIFD